MIVNVNNVDVDTFFTKPQYSEFVWTTHKDKWFLVLSTCWNKYNIPPTVTNLGIIDIIGRTELFKEIKIL